MDLSSKRVKFLGCTGTRLGRGMMRVGEATSADIIVVPDPASADPSTILIAGLIGGWLASPEFAATAGTKGAMLAFRRAVSIPRAFNMTDRFMLQHRELAAEILNVFGRADCKWKLVTAVQLVDMAVARGARETIALVVAGELEEYGFLQHAVTLERAIANEFFCKLVLENCRTGVCTNH